LEDTWEESKREDLEFPRKNGHRDKGHTDCSHSAGLT
jgi:hypothetical protein